jgi:hypothetical protein
MAIYSWTTGVSGNWSTAAAWTPALVPNEAEADVIIDAPPAAGAYTVTIAAGETQTVRSLILNPINNLAGANSEPYNAARVDINGTLNFGPGSLGILGGSLQSFIVMNSGTIINPGPTAGFIQAAGNVLMTGTNGFSITNWLQALAGTVTVDVASITELNGNILFDGIFEAKGDGAVINFGGPRQNLAVNITAIEGPPLIPTGWTEIILNGTLNEIGQWNGSGYVPIESTLNLIASRGTLDIIGGRNYSTTNTLTIGYGGMLNLSAGVVTTGGININAGGVVQGSGTINSGVINNGVLIAEGGLLTIGSGGLAGVGMVEFSRDQKTGIPQTTGTVMEVHGVGQFQTFSMTGKDALVIDTPESFAGTIIGNPGDSILMGGVVANSAVLQGQRLLLLNNGQEVYSLSLAGDYVGDVFAVTALGGGTSTQVTITRPAAPAAATPAPTSAGADDAYIGPVAGLLHQSINITSDSLNINATAPNSFIVTGPGSDTINVSGVNGNNILDGGGGSNFLVGGSGNDTFYLDARNQTSNTFSTIVGFHSGDSATIWGVNLSDFTETLVDNIGVPGATGLALAFSAPGHPTANLILADYTKADLTNGRLTQSTGSTNDLPGLPGSDYVTIRAV